MELTEVKSVGEALAKKLDRLGIKTVEDLINHYPRRYEDYSEVIPVSRIKPGPITIQCYIKQIKGRYVRRGMHITEAIASDDTGSVRLVWFNQPYREGAIKRDQQYFVSGTYELSYQRLSVMNPSVELVSDFPVNTARILPVYRETKGLTSRQIRALLKEIISSILDIKETLPSWLIQNFKLMGRAESIETIHFPKSKDQLEMARHRLGFEEVFQLGLASLLNKYELNQEKAPIVPFDEVVAKDFVKHLPFKLTDAQRKTIWQIYLDLQKPQPMNRLVEGDVGSGKTVVAAMAALMVLQSGHQVAFMAPTELLARQHADTIYKLLKPLGFGGNIGLLVGGMTAVQKKQARENAAKGKLKFLVGTHALIQESVDMDKLELVIIDEQHRFGVEQRKALRAKAGHMPHVLNLTATPIPRSLALTLYGELNISILDAKPEGRQMVETKIVSPNSRAQLYAKIDKELEAGHQMFVVCPLIEESLSLPVVSVEKAYKQLSTTSFKHRRLGLLHGKMKPEEKNKIMEQFVNGQLDILVSTTVIEVGVDVPNATVMLIESAERFGLAQIHQLRGRVGRGGHKGHCYLMLSSSKPPTRRLRAIESSNNGFELAELDLELRGPGAIYGTMQHGQIDLRIANITDVKLIASARKAAQEFIDRGENLLQYKHLAENIKRLRAVTNLD